MDGYVPRRGDLIDFQPQKGKEITKRRPALVISHTAYNQKVGLAICCPITSRKKGYPFEVALPDHLPVKGVILADQIKSLDWKKRHASYIGSVTDEVLSETLEKIRVLIF